VINVKTENEIRLMKEGGSLLSRTLNTLLNMSRPGISTLELDVIAEKMLRETGGKPSFKGYEGFPATICIATNDGLVHGIPNDYVLQEGDVFTIDIGLIYAGFHTDMAHTMIVGGIKDPQKVRFLETGQRSLTKAIKEAKPGNRVGDISAAMQFEVEKDGYSVSKIFTGHGVGRDLHEDPSIYCYGKKGHGELLKPNMVLAIEVIYASGSAEVIVDDDGWTARTADGSLGGLFEHTVAITDKGPYVLTKA